MKRQFDQQKSAKQPVVKRRRVGSTWFKLLKASDDEDYGEEKPVTKRKKSDSSESYCEKRVSSRIKKPKNKEDLGYEEKKTTRPRAVAAPVPTAVANRVEEDQSSRAPKIFVTTVDNAAKQHRDKLRANHQQVNEQPAPQWQQPKANPPPQKLSEQRGPAPVKEMSITERQTLGHNINFLSNN